MSVTVFYQPVTSQKVIENGTESFVTALRETFGLSWPKTFTSEQRKILLAMSYVCELEPNPYWILIDAIDEYGEVLVSPEY